ncbi:MAG TPA: phage Gp37/Gp68 family protein [Desulfobacter sp.]|nr:phage Gp37/Gp68 family protein [Desulfobacter sp.]
MSKTKIEWADVVWNPVTGCSKISPGCANCYAERFAQRLAGRCGYPEDNPFRVTIHPERLNEPSKWHKPQRIFVCSMGDLFHPDVPVDFIRKVLLAMRNFEQHIFLLLTKRPERMREAINQALKITDYCWPLGNVWVGVSAENQQAADKRIPLLLQIPAAVRFVSCEPLLSAIDLSHWLTCACDEYWPGQGHTPDCPTQNLHWCIVGGETGPGARPVHPDWVRSLRDQAVAAGVSFWFKQWGEFSSDNSHIKPGRKYPASSTLVTKTGKPYCCQAIGHSDIWMHRIGKKAAGRLLDGRTWDEYPETEVTR